jgi:hypothetical protein
MDKVIFLDIDGVLNSRKWFKEAYSNGAPKPKFQIDPKTIKLLNHIIYKTGAKIVISSTWRAGREVEWFNWMFNQFGLNGIVIGKTPHINHDKVIIPRGIEIMDFYGRFYSHPGHFKEHPSRLYSYVILDDDDDMLYEQKDNFVQTNFETGLMGYHVPKIIEILNTPLKINYIKEE